MNHLSQMTRAILRETRGKPAQKPAAAPVEQNPALDAVAEDAPAFADEFSAASTSMAAVAAVQEWAETDDLEDGEGYADRLVALLIGAVDEDVDGELSEAEQDDLIEVADAAGDYLASLGVSDDDIDALLNEIDNDAGERVQELVASKLSEGADVTDFVFGDGSDVSALDSAALDAVYKKKLVVRKGKKVRINKRVSGTVRLTAAQKVAVAKARRKANTGMAKLRRAKSMRVRKQAGL